VNANERNADGKTLIIIIRNKPDHKSHLN